MKLVYLKIEIYFAKRCLLRQLKIEILYNYLKFLELMYYITLFRAFHLA